MMLCLTCINRIKLYYRVCAIFRIRPAMHVLYKYHSTRLFPVRFPKLVAALCCRVSIVLKLIYLSIHLPEKKSEGKERARFLLRIHFKIALSRSTPTSHKAAEVAANGVDSESVHCRAQDPICLYWIHVRT